MERCLYIVVSKRKHDYICMDISEKIGIIPVLQVTFGE